VGNFIQDAYNRLILLGGFIRIAPEQNFVPIELQLDSSESISGIVYAFLRILTVQQSSWYIYIL
jgi:hypothetical protein